MRQFQKLLVLLFFVFFVGLQLSAQQVNTTNNTTIEKAVGPIVVQWTPSDSIPKSLVNVRIVVYQQVIASNNLTAYESRLSWNNTKIGVTTTSGEIYAIMPSGTSIPMIYAKFIKWKTINSEEQSIENMQLGTWTIN